MTFAISATIPAQANTMAVRLALLAIGGDLARRCLQKVETAGLAKAARMAAGACAYASGETRFCADGDGNCGTAVATRNRASIQTNCVIASADP